MSKSVKYPNVKVKLVGENGGAFAVLGRVRQALKRAGVSEEELSTFLVEATSGDYNHCYRAITTAKGLRQAA